MNCLIFIHNDYPLEDEKKKETQEMFSDYQLQIIEDNNFLLGLGKDKKLILNLAIKENINSTIKSQNFI